MTTIAQTRTSRRTQRQTQDPKLARLSRNDQEFFAKIRLRGAVVASRVNGVVKGYSHAFFLHGPGGHGKSHHIISTLELVNANWIHHNSNTTAAKLVEILEAYPSHIHFFEDCESMYRDLKAIGVLRSACHAVKGRPRWVTWQTKTTYTRFVFTGGIVIASNEPLSDRGALGAVASRFQPLEWKLTPSEMKAMIRYIAETSRTIDVFDEDGTPVRVKITVRESREVAEFLISEMEAHPNSRIDLRTFCDHALPVFAQWKAGHSAAHWHDVVMSAVKGEARATTREEKSDELRIVAARIEVTVNDGKKKLADFKAETKKWSRDGKGLGKSRYYDLIREARATGLLEQLRKSGKPEE